jgi:hypothetical protein
MARVHLVITTGRQSAKSEIRRPKSEGNPNSEARSTSRSGPAAARRRKAGFGFRAAQTGGGDKLRPNGPARPGCTLLAREHLRSLER